MIQRAINADDKYREMLRQTEFLRKMELYLVYENWNKVVGQSLEFTYYSGVEAGNPSGNANLETMVYKKDGNVTLTRSFTYDANDNVLTDTAS